MQKIKKGVRKIAGKTEILKCTCCGNEKKGIDFYKSYSRIFKNNADSRVCVCKICMLELYAHYLENTGDRMKSVYEVCKKFDTYFDINLFEAADIQCQNSRVNSNVCKIYYQKVNSLKQHQGLTFDASDKIAGKTQLKDELKASEKEVVKETVSISKRDQQNENDVLRILGYDPFETENQRDRKYLFNRLVDMLDDSTLEDNIKLMSVIEIVKGFKQVDVLNEVISNITRDIVGLTANSGGLKSLIDTKKNLMSTILKTAEDNGISTKFNTNKSKGSGTLTGTMKKLNQIGLESSQVNLYDIQTSKGMEQVADLSHQNILKQLNLDENDYTDMLAFQKEELMKLQRSTAKLEEELRLAKKQLKERVVE